MRKIEGAIERRYTVGQWIARCRNYTKCFIPFSPRHVEWAETYLEIPLASDDPRREGIAA